MTIRDAKAANGGEEAIATENTQTAQTRSVIPRWEPHEAHQFTKPYSRRSSKPEWAQEGTPERKPAKAAKTTTERSAKKAPTRAATLTGARGRG